LSYRYAASQLQVTKFRLKLCGLSSRFNGKWTWSWQPITDTVWR